MLVPGGGSVHDPGAKRPDAMWARPMTLTGDLCRGCAEQVGHGAGNKYAVAAGSIRVLVCTSCDGGGRKPNT